MDQIRHRCDFQNTFFSSLALPGFNLEYTHKGKRDLPDL